MSTIVLTLLTGATANAVSNVPSAPTPPASVKATENTIEVTVEGSAFTGGSSGSAGVGGAVQQVPAPCWKYPQDTGKEYYDHVQAVTANQSSTTWTRPGYEKFKDDDKGYWYSVRCDFAYWPDQNDVPGYTKFAEGYSPSEFVPAAQAAPTPEVTPEFLRIIASKNLTLPDPELDWNPKRIGTQGTLVNLDTWFWLDNPPTTLQVQASAGGTRARVIVTFLGMDITAPGEAAVPCDGPGTPYAPGQRTTCALAFSQASSALGKEATPVSVKTRWTGTWSANGTDQGPITPQPNPDPTSVVIRVDEVQTLVTGAR